MHCSHNSDITWQDSQHLLMMIVYKVYLRVLYSQLVEILYVRDICLNISLKPNHEPNVSRMLLVQIQNYGH